MKRTFALMMSEKRFDMTLKSPDLTHIYIYICKNYKNKSLDLNNV